MDSFIFSFMTLLLVNVFSINGSEEWDMWWCLFKNKYLWWCPIQLYSIFILEKKINPRNPNTTALHLSLYFHHMDLEAAWFLSRREAFCNSPTLLDSIFSERFGEGGEGPALPELLRLPSSFRRLTGGIVSFSAIFATCHFWTSKILWW